MNLSINLQKICFFTGEFSKVCDQCWFPYPNRKCSGTRNTPSSLEQCQETCRGDPSCVGVEYWSGIPTVCYVCTELDEVVGFSDSTNPNFPPSVYRRDPTKAAPTMQTSRGDITNKGDTKYSVSITSTSIIGASITMSPLKTTTDQQNSNTSNQVTVEKQRTSTPNSPTPSASSRLGSQMFLILLNWTILLSQKIYD